MKAHAVPDNLCQFFWHSDPNGLFNPNQVWKRKWDENHISSNNNNNKSFISKCQNVCKNQLICKPAVGSTQFHHSWFFSLLMLALLSLPGLLFDLSCQSECDENALEASQRSIWAHAETDMANNILLKGQPLYFVRFVVVDKSTRKFLFPHSEASTVGPN